MTRCAVCNALYGLVCHLDGPRPDCPRTQFLQQTVDPRKDDRMIDLDRLRDLATAATPGPWRWGGNTQSRELYLSTVDHGRRFVMQFVSWEIPAVAGQPRFRTAPGEAGHMVDAATLARYEVLDGRTMQEAGENPYRHDVVGIDNPDATYIAAASPDVILRLLSERDHIADYLRFVHCILEAAAPPREHDEGHYANRALTYVDDLLARLAGHRRRAEPLCLVVAMRKLAAGVYADDKTELSRAECYAVLWELGEVVLPEPTADAPGPDTADRAARDAARAAFELGEHVIRRARDSGRPVDVERYADLHAALERLLDHADRQSDWVTRVSELATDAATAADEATRRGRFDAFEPAELSTIHFSLHMTETHVAHGSRTVDAETARRLADEAWAKITGRADAATNPAPSRTPTARQNPTPPHATREGER